MSIQSEIDRINNAKSEIASAISSKGVSVAGDTNIEDLPALIRSIPQEGGENVSDLFKITCDFNAETMQVENVSHTASEIFEAYNNGKIIQLVARIDQEDSTLLVMLNLQTISFNDMAIVVTIAGFMMYNGSLLYIQANVIENVIEGGSMVSTAIKVISTLG